MRILVTGASGWIGSACVPELLKAGHEVLGLARSDASAKKISELGATPVLGSFEDLNELRAIAKKAQGVVHLGYIHDFSRMEDAARTDRKVIEIFGEELAGSGGPLIIASGLLGLATGRLGTELDRPDPTVHARIQNAALTLDLAEKRVRSIVVRFAPTVHGSGGDHGFIQVLSSIARERGISGYIGDGSNRWSAVHRLDAASLIQLAVDNAPAGSVLHAASEVGVPAREIAQALGQFHGIPVECIPADQASAHFGWIGMFFGMDAQGSSEMTQKMLGWQPTHPTLLEDIANGYYPG